MAEWREKWVGTQHIYKLSIGNKDVASVVIGCFGKSLSILDPDTGKKKYHRYDGNKHSLDELKLEAEMKIVENGNRGGMKKWLSCLTRRQ